MISRVCPYIWNCICDSRFLFFFFLYYTYWVLTDFVPYRKIVYNVSVKICIEKNSMFSLEFLPCISTHSKRYLRVEDIGKNLINWIYFPTKVIVVNLKQFNSIPGIIYRVPLWVQIATFATGLEGKEPIVPTLGTFWPSTVTSYIPIKLQYLIWKFKSSFKKWLKGRKKKNREKMKLMQNQP